jgi:hypothetical protein
VQIKTVCWWVSLESSVGQEIVAGAVAVGDAVGVSEAELKADAVGSEATAWPPQAVSARRAALAITAVLASRPETGESRLSSADWQDISFGNRILLRPKRVFICAPTNQIQMKVLADFSTGTRVRYRLLYSTKSVIYAIKVLSTAMALRLAPRSPVAGGQPGPDRLGVDRLRSLPSVWSGGDIASSSPPRLWAPDLAGLRLRINASVSVGLLLS